MKAFKITGKFLSFMSNKRISKVAGEFNVGTSTIMDFLNKKGFSVQNPNAKISEEAYRLVEKEFKGDITLKKESEKMSLKSQRPKKETLTLENSGEEPKENKIKEEENFSSNEIRITNPSGLNNPIIPKVEKKKPTKKIFRENIKPIEKPKIVGKIDLTHPAHPSKEKEEKKNTSGQATIQAPRQEKVQEKVQEKEKVQTPIKEKIKVQDSREEKKVQNTPIQEKVQQPKKEEKKEPVIIKEELKRENVKIKSPKPQKEIIATKATKHTAENTDHKTKNSVIENPKQSKKEEIPQKKEETPVREEEKKEPEILRTKIPRVEKVKVVGKIDLSAINQKTRPAKKTKKQKEEERIERGKARKQQYKDANKSRNKTDVTGDKKTGNTGDKKIGEQSDHRKKRRRIPNRTGAVNNNNRSGAIGSNNSNKNNQRNNSGKSNFRQHDSYNKNRKRPVKKEIDEKQVQKQIKDTLARLTSSKKTKGSKYRKDKRLAASERAAVEQKKQNEEKKTLKVTEFVSVSELATMMNVNVNEVIATCMNLGLFVSINQRLDAETLTVVADEFGFKVEFVSSAIDEIIDNEDDLPDEVHPRVPIVTVMGHVDHGKTSLLDYIRNTNVIAGEAGGITQHIGAYNVTLKNGRHITFLDTPGHEAFTAMRARGAQITDIAIIVVAADDGIMPQTTEAINHAQAAGVPIVFAINKIDKPGANPERIKEELASKNLLVEEWGGKYQSEDISAKKGTNIHELLEKVLLEADMLELKANKDKRAIGTVVESSLDKGRGYMATMIVQNGTLHEGDTILSGQYYGNVKAMFNERNQRIKSAGPSDPVIVLGLDGAPQAGDKFNVISDEREARILANKRQQLAREQGLRTQKHITLSEIGRRIAIGNFQELNIIVKGDVDGSIEALSDTLIKLSTEEIQVNVIHKAVGAISESDVMLATASDAIIVGFQVRPTLQARKLAEKEQVDIQLYSIIYDAIKEIKSAMEGMLSPEIKEEIRGTAEVTETFKIKKVGTIAGCIIRDGKISRSNKVRVIRDGIVIYTGTLGSLKRFKEDVKEVSSGYECGLNIENYNDIKIGDSIEAFEQVEIAKTL